MALNTPDSDQRGFRETSPGLRAVIICTLSVALMVADNRSQLLVDVRRVLAATAYPLQILIDSPVALGRWLADSFATRNQLREQNDELQRQLLTQNAQLQRFDALEAENTRLRALLKSTPKLSDRVLIAEIMSVDMNPFRHRIIVNKGGRDGVFVGQSMIDAEGVVGQITRDQVFSAEAILITDVDHALPVEILRSGQRTIAVGTGQLDRLSLPFLPRNADVVKGDLLVTSGLGGTFPAGYPVGVVEDVGGDAGQPFLTVFATPSAALSRIREVLLIWPGASAADTAAAETDEQAAEAEEPAAVDAIEAATPADPGAPAENATGVAAE